MKFYKGWLVKKLKLEDKKSSALIEQKNFLKEKEFFSINYPMQFLSTEGKLFYFPELEEDVAIKPKWAQGLSDELYLLRAMKFNKIMQESSPEDLKEVIKDNNDKNYSLEDYKKVI